MAFSELERIRIRKWLGFPTTFLQSEPRLENAITAAQAQADGGVRPDDALEVEIRTVITKLEVLSDKLDAFDDCASTIEVKGIVMDKVRARAVNVQSGRRMVGYLADMLWIQPRRDVWSTPDYGGGSPLYQGIRS